MNRDAKIFNKRPTMEANNVWTIVVRRNKVGHPRWTSLRWHQKTKTKKQKKPKTLELLFRHQEAKKEKQYGHSETGKQNHLTVPRPVPYDSVLWTGMEEEGLLIR